MASPPLKRVLGLPTAFLLALGVAVGSGIFRTPGLVAEALGSSGWILLAWTCGGVVVLMQGMVTAELATRFPQAGGEYVFLRETYGRFMAFFFGWGYTVFIVGGGSATIAAGFGDFACELFGLEDSWSGAWGAGAIVAVVAVNAMGLRAGAGFQNVLSVAKVTALVVLAAIGLIMGTRALSTWGPDVAATADSGQSWLTLLAAGFLPVLWCYSGTTDAAKMAEEIKGVRRALPRALIGSAVTLTAVYVMINAALMRVLAPSEMAGAASAPGEAMGRLLGPWGQSAVLVVAMLVCLAAISATILATVRVTFALARDGLAFRAWSRMSRRQAPVSALIAVGAFAAVLVWFRSFEKVLQIYFFAAPFLFGLTYACLIVQRVRERTVPSGVWRCPAGVLQAGALILLQAGIATSVAIDNPYDAAWTGGMLVAVALFYFVWIRFAGPGARAR
ncbi:MAG: amino acid permease [bacterium]|nr:amino acid permease [bacterium]